MRRTWLIARRELRERIGQRAYLIALAVGALLAAAAVIGPGALDGSDSSSSTADATPEPVVVAIVGTRGSAASPLRALQDAEGRMLGTPLRFELRRDADEVRQAVRDDDVSVGAVVTGPPASPRLVVVTREGDDGSLAGRLADVVDRAAQERRLADAGARLTREDLFAAVPIDAQEVRGPGPTGAAAAVVSVLGLLLYIAGILLTTAFATGLVSDRTNHVTERLLTAVRPTEHLAGKLLGVGGAGLLQFAVWIASALVADLVAGDGTALDRAPTALLLFFPVALLLTYALYAAIASVLILPVRKAEDVSGAVGPAMILQIVGFIVATSVVAPGSTVSGAVQVLSLVPFFSPLLMLARLAGGDVPAWEVAVAVVGPIVLAILLLRLAAPAYARYAIEAPGGKGLRAAVAALRR